MQAILYSDGSQECERIRMLLKSLGGEYLEYEKRYNQPTQKRHQLH